MFTFSDMKTIYDGSAYNRATNILNEALEQEEGFCMWIDLPDGSQFQVPTGSRLHTLNYSISRTR